MTLLDLLVDATTAAGTSLLVTWLHRRVFCGPRGSRWCRKCYARAVVKMDGWDTCLFCGDSTWGTHLDAEPTYAASMKPFTVIKGDKK